jgi:hypothetical protein
MKTSLARTVGALAVVLFPMLANAQFTLTPIVTTSTPIPGGTGNFKGFRGPNGSGPLRPSIDGTSVVFTAIDSNDRSGIYRWDNGVISKVVDTNTPIPGRSDNFTVVGLPSISGGQVAFAGWGPGVDGLFLYSGGQVLPVASAFIDISAPSLFEGQVAYSTTGPTEVYRYKNGVNTRIARGYQSLGDPHIGRGGYVAFEDTSISLSGVYLVDANNVLSTVADTHTPVPGATGSFSTFRFGRVSSDGADVAFAGYHPTKSGIYAKIDGVLKAIAVNGQTALNGQTMFLSEAYDPDVSLDNKHVAFWFRAGTAQNEINARGTIYTNYRDRIERVIGDGDLLQGKFVQSVFMSTDALSGDKLVFTVMYTDESTAIYMATLPEPASLMVLLPLALLIRRENWRHRPI